jgi:hypothetical protein
MNKMIGTVKRDIIDKEIINLRTFIRKNYLFSFAQMIFPQL